jgi:glycosyltransferase involved in cell wall biosynthesis
MLIATYITFDDIDTIQQSVESVIDQVDQIYFIDGKFRDFPADNLISEDGTLEYLQDLQKKHPQKVKVVTIKNQDEVGKRNVYLMMMKAGDVILNVDADEVLVGEIPYLDMDIGKIIIEDAQNGRTTLRCSRFFKMKKGLHYWRKHYLIMDKDEQLFATLKVVGKQYSVQTVNSFLLKNMHHKRSAGRQLKKKAYYRKLVIRETQWSDYGD